MRFYTKITLLKLMVGFLPLTIMGIITLTNIENNIQETAHTSLHTLAVEVGKEEGKLKHLFFIHFEVHGKH